MSWPEDKPDNYWLILINRLFEGMQKISPSRAFSREFMNLRIPEKLCMFVKVGMGEPLDSSMEDYTDQARELFFDRKVAEFLRSGEGREANLRRLHQIFADWEEGGASTEAEDMELALNFLSVVKSCWTPPETAFKR